MKMRKKRAKFVDRYMTATMWLDAWLSMQHWKDGECVKAKWYIRERGKSYLPRVLMQCNLWTPVEDVLDVHGLKFDHVIVDEWTNYTAVAEE